MAGLPPGRSRGGQGDRQRIAAQHDEDNQPSNGPLGIRVSAEEFGDIADRRGLRLNLAALSGHLRRVRP
jgi:hypothetical protein